MMSNVRAHIEIKAKVSVLNDKSSPTSRPPRESREQQWISKTKIIADNIDYNDWKWRLAVAAEVLQDGETDTTGTYYGDVIGGIFIL